MGERGNGREGNGREGEWARGGMGERGGSTASTHPLTHPPTHSYLVLAFLMRAPKMTWVAWIFAPSTLPVTEA